MPLAPPTDTRNLLIDVLAAFDCRAVIEEISGLPVLAGEVPHITRSSDHDVIDDVTGETRTQASDHRREQSKVPSVAAQGIKWRFSAFST